MMLSNNKGRRQHHALAVALPGQGHMNPLMRLCKSLALHHGFTITFVNFASVQRRIDAAADLLDHQPQGDTSPPPPSSIRMATIPIPTPPATGADARFNADFVRSLRAVERPLEDLVHTLSAQGSPPVTCVISDVFISSSTQKLADKLHLPRIAFFPSCQALNLLFTYNATGVFPLDEVVNAALHRDLLPQEPINKTLEGFPRLNNRDLPAFKHDVHDETKEVTTVLLEEFRHLLTGGTAIVVNSFEELEGPAFRAQAKHLPLHTHVYPIGPLLEDISSDNATNVSLWKEDSHSISWLDTKPPHSVLYISFGSITTFSKAQFEEFLSGLEASSQSFLLVFRPGLVVDDASSYISLPKDFLARTKDRGYIVNWAPQLRVLSHIAVGGFLTHCGWNSTLEAIFHGVPMLCWPYFADQFLDAKYIVEEWKIGIRIEASASGAPPLVTRYDIEDLIKSLMVESPKREVLRERAMRLSRIAKGCHLVGGSSYKNIQAIIEKLSV